MARKITIIDEEYENNPDIFSQYLRFANIGNQQTSTITIINEQQSNTLLSFSTTEKVVVEFSPIHDYEYITEQILPDLEAGYSATLHNGSVVFPEPDNLEDTFNFNNYSTDFFSFYNIRNERYELFTEEQRERALPNFCLGALWDKGEETTEQEKFYTMFNQLPSLKEAKILAGFRGINNFEFDEEAIGEEDGGEIDYTYEEKIDYFKQLITITSSVSVQRYVDSNAHVYVDFEYTRADSEKIGNCPFFNSISLPLLDTTPINIETTGLDITFSIFTRRVVEAFQEGYSTDVLIKSFRNDSAPTREFRVTDSSTGTTTTQPIKVYDVPELILNDGWSAQYNPSETDEMFLRSTDQEYSKDNNFFVFVFNKMILVGKLRALLRDRHRMFNTLITDPAKSLIEQVGYKVEKRRDGRDEAIQTFYFLNRDGLQEFIDTQVRIDTVYHYKIFSMLAIFGTEYTYSNVTWNQQSGVLSFDFTSTPSLKIAEILTAEKTLRIVEPPPIVPEIMFYNEMTTKNVFKIMLKHQDGNLVDEFSRKPLRPFGNNAEYIGKLKQYFGGTDDILVTSGKTSSGVYEIYRIEEPPETYADFEGALISTVESPVVYRNGEIARSTFFIDAIRHEKKYYYAFRVLTHRSNPSELSPVYCVEMYEDADETHLIWDIYEPPEKNNRQTDTSMRKYLQIIPNSIQTITNGAFLLENYESAQDAFNSGDALFENTNIKESIWKFKDKQNYLKLRLESENSGRKMDINLIFEIKKQT